MNKNIFLSIFLIFSCCYLSGCGNKSADTNEVVDVENGTEASSESSNNSDQSEKSSTKQGNESESKNNSSNDSNIKSDDSQNTDEVVEGKVDDGKGSYKITKSDNLIVMDFNQEKSSYTAKYEFSDNKLSNFTMVEHYKNEDDAKETYNDLKDNEQVKSIYKDIKLNGSEITYVISDDGLDALKQKSKDEIFNELKESIKVEEE